MAEGQSGTRAHVWHTITLSVQVCLIDSYSNVFLLFNIIYLYLLLLFCNVIKLICSQIFGTNLLFICVKSEGIKIKLFIIKRSLIYNLFAFI